MASARGLASPPSCSYQPSCRYREQKIVEDFFRLRCRANAISEKQFFYWQRILRKEAYEVTCEANLLRQKWGFLLCHSQTSEGKTKIQALLCIMRRLVNIIYSMMKNKTAYQLPQMDTVEKEQMIS